jgi:hypothetical protein
MLALGSYWADSRALRRLLAIVAAVPLPLACGSGEETSVAREDGGLAGTDGAIAGSSGHGDGGVSGVAGSGGIPGPDASLGGTAGSADRDAEPSTDAGPGDGGFDAIDAVIDAPVSIVCGDGVRDPVLEECDDGTGSNPPDSCTTDCRVEDVLVHPQALVDASVVPARRVGVGRHAVAAGDSGFAIASVRTQPGPTAINVRTFDTKGVPGSVLEVSDGSIIASTHPTLAALPGGKYALVYTDNGADGSGRGVALRILDFQSASIGPLQRVNATTSGNQSDADVIWTGTSLAVSWVDESKLTTALLNTTLRTFFPTGSPLTGESSLASSALSEADVSLAAHNGSWAAAWRTYPGPGIPPIVSVRAGSKSWSTSLTAAGAADEKPALVSLDASHLVVFFVDGSGGPTPQRLRAALLDTTAVGEATSFPVEPLVEPYKSDDSLWQMHIAAVRAGDRVFVSWRSKPVVGSQDADEIWLKEIPWNASGGGVTLDLSDEEIPLPRSALHRAQGQQRPGLALMQLPFEGALATVWEDYGQVFGATEALPDVVAELLPLPIVRIPDADGGLGK